MPSRSILLTDDLGDSSRAGIERSAALRRLTKDLAERLHLGIRFLYVDTLVRESRNLQNVSSKKIQLWQRKIHNTFQGVKSSLPEEAEFLLRVGSPAHEILEIIEDSPHPELVIMGTRGLKGLKKLFMGSIAEEVLRHSARPVLVLGPAALKSRFPQSQKKSLRFLLLTDLSKASRPAEHYAQSLAKKLKAHIVLCHSLGDQIYNINTSFYSTGYTPSDLDEVFDEMKAKAQSQLEKKRDQLFERDISVETKMLMHEAPLASTLTKELQAGYDLVIMGTHSRTPVMGALLGSSTRTAILQAPTPVLVVRSL